MPGTKVCQLTNVHSPLDQRIYYKEALSLAAAGYHVSVVGPGPTRHGGRSQRGCGW